MAIRCRPTTCWIDADVEESSASSHSRVHLDIQPCYNLDLLLILSHNMRVIQAQLMGPWFLTADSALAMGTEW